MVMINVLLTMMAGAGVRLWDAVSALFWPALIFAAIALLVKRKKVFADLGDAKHEIRINVIFHLFNAIILAPLVFLAIVITQHVVASWGLVLVPESVWSNVNGTVLLVIALFLGDLTGYVRHRIEHTKLIWPVHAVHHSDTHLTWISFARIHPINQVTTAIFDLAVLSIIGLPSWAITGGFLLRHYYGMLIHANVPWTYGWLGNIFVSPAMHHWHHVREGEALNNNFSIVFAFIDKMFGTFYLPGPCTVATGVEDQIGKGFVGHFAHPLKVWQGWLDDLEAPEHRSPDGDSDETKDPRRRAS